MPARITSSQNQFIKLALRLRDRRGRQRLGRIVIDGSREIRRAMEAGVEIERLFLADGVSLQQEGLEALRAAESSGAAVLTVAPVLFDKISYGERDDGLVAIAATPSSSLDRLTPRDHPRIVVLERVEKPGNVGAVLRSSDAAGMSAMIVADAATDLYNPNAIRASLGTIFSLPVVGTDARTALEWLTDRGYRILAARVEGSTDYTRASYDEPFALVLGSEAHGLSDVWLGESVTSISLPMLGVSDSLNVSATAAVLSYEALRQRRSPGAR